MAPKKQTEGQTEAEVVENEAAEEAVINDLQDADNTQEDDGEDFGYLLEDEYNVEEVPAEVSEGKEGGQEEEVAEIEQPAEKPEVPEEKAPEQQEAEKPEESARKEQPEEKKPVEPETPPEPTDLNAQYKEFFARSIDALEKEVYQLSPEEAEALDTSPSEYAPKFAARLHMQVLTGVVTQMTNMMPVLMEHFGSQRSAEQEAENAFYTKYSQFKPQEHGETIERLATAYRQQNPKATMEQAMDEVAAMAMVTLRLPFEGMPQQANQQDTVTTPPPAPASAKGGAQPTTRQARTEWDELLEIEE